jgi:predicted dehydrogenase
MRKLKIAQVGTGHDHAHVVFLALQRLSDIFEIVGYADVTEDDLPYTWTKNNRINNAYAYEKAKKYTVDELLAMDDLDAVIIETYDLNLVKYAQKFAEKGVHIHMDKAGGESAEEFEKLLSTIKAKNLVFNMGYMYRFNPMLQKTFAEIKQGKIGRVYSVEAEMSCYYAKDKREWLGGLKSGMMQYLGCHLIDLVARLLGTPEEIIPYNFSTGADGVRSLDTAFAVLKYPNALATVKSSMLDAGGYLRRHLIIHGEKGTLEVKPLEYYTSDSSKISTKRVDTTPQDGWLGGGTIAEEKDFDRYEGMLSAFYEMVVNGKQGVVSLEEEATIQRCLLTAGGFDCDFKKKIVL